LPMSTNYLTLHWEGNDIGVSSSPEQTAQWDGEVLVPLLIKRSCPPDCEAGW